MHGVVAKAHEGQLLFVGVIDVGCEVPQTKRQPGIAYGESEVISLTAQEIKSGGGGCHQLKNASASDGEHPGRKDK